MSTMAAPSQEVRAANTVEVVGRTLVVDVGKRSSRAMFIPTMKIPLEHVLGAEADPEIERKSWRAWVFGNGAGCVPEPGVRFYNPRHFLAHKAVVIRLKDEPCERLVVEVRDPEGVATLINQALEASSRPPTLV